MFKKINKIWHIKPLLTVLLATFLIGGGYFYYSNRPQKSPTTQDAGVVTTQSGGTMNLSPPTSIEKQVSESKKVPTGQPTTAIKTADGRIEVSIVVTSSNPSAVRAYVQGAVEDGGTCTATFTKGSDIKTSSSLGVGNVSSTVCPAINVGSLEPGTWNLSYTYSSDKYTGTVNKTIEL